ncbi:MAG: tyrosine-type recombinase/integrase [Patescibacteria group bacterium]|nr:tyrosine-type recombinase/integrase [Patescibacteria group bacterium]
MDKFKGFHTNFISNLKKRGKATATVVAYSKDIDQLLSHIENLGRGVISDIKKEDLEHFLETLRKTNYTPKSVSRKINATRTFFRYLAEEKIITKDPAQLITHPKLDPKKPRILSKVEYRALRDAAKTDFRSAAMVEVLLQTGVRISELANIRLSDIEFGENGKAGKMHVPRVETKEERNIPLNAVSQKAIREYLEIRPKSKKDYLFITKTGNPLLIRNIRATIDRLFRLAGVEQVKVNDLRHTFVVHHLRMGVNITHLSKIAGHKRLSTTEKYLEFVEQRAETSEKLELVEL